ncbi:hypothetical protein CNMCM5793_005556 [Aspergillus hiratsukae]|uniref:DUF7029 domain-containing protein n=1 Tax=Aspergillus hiratsukae TaxID=1194566 RepID=A0A8H6P3Q7_9EURO|nr:hypothetical protein CNMCM5793_005556 [Aspergillus hiratsukae]KAF7170719.1 hypothetical protein CNMCM6106_005312 [Aspergillus hiratsukae]
MARSILAIAACLSVISSAHPLSARLYPTVLRRDTTTASLEPASAISLYYQAVNSSSIGAVVQADLQLPSMVLEDVNDISSVTCSAESVTVTFNSTTTFHQAYTSWPRSHLLLVTNHLGNCDAEAERGIYHAASLLFDPSTLTITAATSKTNLQAQAKTVTIAFGHSAPSQRKRKRELPNGVHLAWSGDLIRTTGLTIHANQATLDAAITIDGIVAYNVETKTAISAGIDIALALDSGLSISTSAAGSFLRNVYTYKWSPIESAGFSIPGILDVGPLLDLNVGVDMGMNGSANVSSNMTMATNGLFHLDLLNMTDSTARGVAPTATSTSSMDTAADMQLDPFVGAEVGVTLNLFEGLLDLSSWLGARATVVNVMNVDADMVVGPDGNVTMVPPADGTSGCENGYWFTSDFWFNVTARMTALTTMDLYHLDMPMVQTECILF